MRTIPIFSVQTVGRGCFSLSKRDRRFVYPAHHLVLSTSDAPGFCCGALRRETREAGRWPVVAFRDKMPWRARTLSLVSTLAFFGQEVCWGLQSRILGLPNCCGRHWQFATEVRGV